MSLGCRFTKTTDFILTEKETEVIIEALDLAIDIYSQNIRDCRKLGQGEDVKNFIRGIHNFKQVKRLVGYYKK